MKTKRRNTIIAISSIVLGFILLTIGTCLLAHFSPNKIYIESEEDLINMSNQKDGYYVLNRDITLTKSWTAIGSKDEPFSGSLVGNGHTISFLGLEEPFARNEIDDTVYYSFFGHLTGTVLRTKFYGIHAKIKETSKENLLYSSIAYTNNGRITSCELANSGITLDGNNVCAGLLAAKNYGNIKNCGVYAQLEATVSGNCFLGGIIGEMNDGIVEQTKRETTTYFKINSNCETNDYKVGLGTIIGAMYGGTAKNNLCGCASNSINNSGKEKVFIGGVSGLINPKQSILIQNNYCINKSFFGSNSNSDRFSGGIAGCFENKHQTNSIKITNCVIELDSNFLVKTSGAYTSMIGEGYENSNIEIINMYSTLFKAYGDHNNQCGVDTVSYSDLSLRKLNWNEAIWNINKDGILFLKGKIE